MQDRPFAPIPVRVAPLVADLALRRSIRSAHDTLDNPQTVIHRTYTHTQPVMEIQDSRVMIRGVSGLVGMAISRDALRPRGDGRPGADGGPGWDMQPWHHARTIRPGALAARVFRHEDKGERIKR